MKIQISPAWDSSKESSYVVSLEDFIYSGLQKRSNTGGAIEEMQEAIDVLQGVLGRFLALQAEKGLLTSSQLGYVVRESCDTVTYISE
jgi:hypothetical protein